MSKLKSSFLILKNFNLVIECHKGELDLASFIKFKKQLSQHPDFTPNLNCFICFKKVIFNTSSSDIEDYISFLKENSSVFGKRKIALITDTPNQVVSTTLYKTLQENLNQSVEIFSTNEKAIEWLNISKFSKDDFYNYFNKIIDKN